MQIPVDREAVRLSVRGPRKLGTPYVCSAGPPVTECDRLPIDLGRCPVCGYGFKPSRQPGVIHDPDVLLGGRHRECNDRQGVAACPICWPTKAPMLLFWLPQLKYTVASWLQEVENHGYVSWGVAHIPQAIVAGKSTCLVAVSKPTPRVVAYWRYDHAEVVLKRSDLEDTRKVARYHIRKYRIFYVDDHDPAYQEQPY